MKEIVEFGGLPHRHDDPGLYRQLVSIYPEGDRNGGVFLCGFPLGDQRIESIQRVMHDAGYKIHRRMTQGAPREYLMHIRRKYDNADLRACEYLELAGALQWNGGEFYPGGPIELQLDQRLRMRDIAQVDEHRFIVSEHFRQLLHEAGLRHMKVLPTSLTDCFIPESRTRKTWDAIGEPPWWHLTSDLVLPRVAPGSEIVDSKGEPFIEGKSMGCYLVEVLYWYPEIHYRRTDLAAVEPFDLALTHECFGRGRHEENRKLIVSQKVYRLFVDHKIKAGFVPVRVDED